jgi:antitoxin component of RelBE/YafQ-DinJ toxin-antitoxin module
MDARVTLSFDENIIEKAKIYAADKGLTLSRLTEILLRKVTYNGYANIEDVPVADWVTMVSEGEAEYITAPRKRKQMREEYYKSKK